MVEVVQRGHDTALAEVRHARQCRTPALLSTPMSELPPPDWYIDPENHRQYRYWDGEKWTDHRAPREAGHEGVRPVGALVSETFSMITRRWQSYVIVVLVAAVATLIGFGFAYAGASELLGGELGEVMNRVLEPGFDPESADNEAYFESIEVAVTPTVIAFFVVGALIWIAASIVGGVAVSWLAAADMKGGRRTPTEALTGAVTRVPRMLGLVLQLLALFGAATIVMVIFAFISPFFLILLIRPFW